MTPDDIREFLDRLDRYGGTLDDWPPLARAAADAVLEASAEARAQLASMRRAEAALADTQGMSAATASMLAVRAMQSRQEGRRERAARRLSWAVAGALALVAGLCVGALPRTDEGPSDLVTAALDQSGGHDVW